MALAPNTVERYASTEELNSQVVHARTFGGDTFNLGEGVSCIDQALWRATHIVVIDIELSSRIGLASSCKRDGDVGGADGVVE